MTQVRTLKILNLQVLRAFLAGILVLALFSNVEATLNIMGMPMAVHPVGDVMDFSMGSNGPKKGGLLSSDCEDEDDDDDDDYYPESGSSGNCLDVKPSAWTLSNVSQTASIILCSYKLDFKGIVYC